MGREEADSLTRYAAWSACALALTYAVISLQGIGTLWDCANFLYSTLDSGQALAATNRYTDLLFGWVVLAARRFTDSVQLLAATYGFAHLSVTLGAFILSMRLLRQSGDPERLIAALMVLVVPLPGQAYVCTDVNHVAVLTPVLIALAVTPMTGKRIALFALVGAYCLSAHPASVFVFALLTAALIAKRYRGVRPAGATERAALALSAVLLAASSGRFLFGLTEYERSEAALATVAMHFRLSLFGLAGIGLVAAYAAAVALFASGRHALRVPEAVTWRFVACAALLLGAGCLGLWALHVSAWIHGDTYRKFASLLNLPAGVLLAAAVLRPPRLSAEHVAGIPRYLAVAALVIIVAMHAGCLLIQSSRYAHLRARLNRELAHAQSGVVFVDEQHWAYMTPLRNWVLPYNSILIQGRRPVAIATTAPPREVTVRSEDRTLHFSNVISMSLASTGWFRFDALRPIAAAAPPPGSTPKP